MAIPEVLSENGETWDEAHSWVDEMYRKAGYDIPEDTKLPYPPIEPREKIKNVSAAPSKNSGKNIDK